MGTRITAGPLALPRHLWAELVAHLASCLPLEGVGYLAGLGGAPTLYVPLDNELRSPTRFRASAASSFRAHKLMRAVGLDLAVVVHSHPTSPPVPSAIDLAENPYGELVPWLIVGFPPEARLWRLGDAATELPWRLV